MNRSIAILLFLLLSCASAGTGHRAPGALPEDRPQPQVAAASLEKRIHLLINKERLKHDLQPLEQDSALVRIARKHSKDMGARNYFGHVSPEGHDFSFRYRDDGYSCGIRVGRTIHQGAENILQNNLYDRVVTTSRRTYYEWNDEEKIAETTVSGWMRSPGHRKNILTPHWKNEGIGVFITPEGKVYITQNFC